MSASLLISTSGFYFINGLGISPIYPLFLLSLLFFLIFLSNKDYLPYNSLLGYFLFYGIYLTISQFLFSNPDFHTFINVILNIPYFILGFFLMQEMKEGYVISILKRFLLFSVLLLIVEFIYRITHPVFILEDGTKDLRDSSDLIFYAYKKSSLMFEDSNFTGIYAMIVFFLAWWSYKNNFYKSRSLLCVLFLLILGSLSRSAILATIISLIILPFFLNKRISFIKIITLILVSSFIFLSTLKLIGNDLSFDSKFLIFEKSVDYISKASLNDILFGVGFGNTDEYIGIGAHNLILTHLLESGVFGFFLFFFIQYQLIKRSNRQMLYLFIPFFIAGFSLMGHALTFYFTAAAIIIVVDSYTKKTIRWT